MYRNLLTVRNFIGNATRYFASDAAAVLKSTSTLAPPKKPAGWTMPEKTAYIAKTSNRAEFVAMIEAVKQAHKNGEKELTVRTESEFLHGCMTRWVSGWKANGWKKRDGQEVKNKDLIQELDDLSAKLNVKYELIGSDKESKPKESGPRAKLIAAIETVKQAIANGQKEVTVRTDSDFLHSCMTRWVSGWKENGWKKKDGQEVKNKDLIQELDNLSAKLEVKYELV